MNRFLQVTTDLVRDLAAEAGLATADFDRWLAAHDAEVRAEERRLLEGDERP